MFSQDEDAKWSNVAAKFNALQSDGAEKLNELKASDPTGTDANAFLFCATPCSPPAQLNKTPHTLTWSPADGDRPAAHALLRWSPSG